MVRPLHGSAYQQFETSADQLTVGTWTHIVFTYTFGTAASAKFYINGNTTAVAATWISGTGTTAPTVDNDDFYIGNQNGTVSAIFDGWIDDVRLYRAIIGSTTIANLGSTGVYSGGVTGTATYTLGTNLDVDNNLWIDGGLLSASANTIKVGKDWHNPSGATAFVPGTGTVNLDGNGGAGVSQQIYDTSSFYVLQKNVTSACTLTLPAAKTQTISGTLELNGASGQLLTIATSSPTTQSIISASGSRSCSYLSVSNQSNTAFPPYINPTNSTDVSNNTGWFGTNPSTRKRGGAGAGYPAIF